MKKKIILITILFLTIGFAAVTTTLVINGNSTIGTNQEDFDVYFSSAIIDSEDHSNEVISEDRLSISYQTKELAYKGDTSILEYEVTNASKNYDAEVNVVCTGMTDVVTITHTPENQIIEATSVETGTVTVELKKTLLEEKKIEFTCTLIVEAIERTSLGENDAAALNTYSLIGKYLNENDIAIPYANLVIYSETPHYVTTDVAGNLYYDGLERGIHEIYYVEDTLSNIKSMSKEEIKENAVSYSQFATNTYEENILFDNNSKITNTTIVKSYEYCKALVNRDWHFSYIGDAQEFKTMCDGTYKIELWGAQGGSYNETYVGGNGGYTAGNIELPKTLKLYLYIGGKGTVGSTSGAGGGYNGGGTAQIYKASVKNRYGGGGATDVRLVNGIWNDNDGLKSRIMVAGGGGGISEQGYGYHNTPNMRAGGLIGYDGGGLSGGGGAYQNRSGSIYTSSFGSAGAGAFGYGGYGSSHASGGGSGYYGGSGGARETAIDGNGGGGSSFISGHNGCDAIAENSTSSNIIHTGQANHYSGYIFKDTVMIDGAGYNWTTEKGEYIGMPTYDGTATMTGNTGNGYAKITLLSID